MRRVQLSILSVLALLTTAVALVAAFVLRHDLALFLSTQTNTDGRQPARTTASVSRQFSPVGGVERMFSGPSTPVAPTFDAVQVSPDGPSVFAGRAPPGSHVTVLANERPIAAATADEHGDWVVVTEKKIGGGDHKFSLTARLGRDGAPIYGQIVGRSVASPPPSNKVTPAKVSEAVSPGQLPRPITFVYDQTTFTAEGRRAAQMLAEYLRTRRHQTITLTGHADERGSDSYNMELSRHRLETVARYLRESSVTNELVLVPKGRSEPFAGADRRLIGREDALQLDRRVETRPQR
jgi:outer membrane protein OmpA-like peptidoglycan-associated protein